MDKDKVFREAYRKAMDCAVRLLSRRNHTKHELRQKLRQREFHAEIISDVISECERLRYVNDEETARVYLRELRRKGYGSWRVRFSMRKKGLENDLTDMLLSEENSESDELETARGAIRKKRAAFDREKDMRKKKEKIYRFLCSRGFASSVISELIRRDF